MHAITSYSLVAVSFVDCVSRPDGVPLFRPHHPKRYLIQQFSANESNLYCGSI